MLESNAHGVNRHRRPRAPSPCGADTGAEGFKWWIALCQLSIAEGHLEVWLSAIDAVTPARTLSTAWHALRASQSDSSYFYNSTFIWRPNLLDILSKVDLFPISVGRMYRALLRALLLVAMTIT